MAGTFNGITVFWGGGKTFIFGVIELVYREFPCIAIEYGIAIEVVVVLLFLMYFENKQY